MIDISKKQAAGFIPHTISQDQAKDTGMAMVLICLLIGYFGNNRGAFLAAIPLLLINMIWPSAYTPVAKVWLGLSHLMGTVVSRILLTIVFFTIVTPVGCLRKLFGADPLQLKKWKKGTSSVFRQRNHTFAAKDIQTPY